MGKFIDFLFGPPTTPPETKSVTTTVVPTRSAEYVEDRLRENLVGTSAIAVSAVFACARVIAEGLALPPCYLHKSDLRGKVLATGHPLYRLLNLAPNDRQTSYEFREQIGLHLALNGNAHVWLNRSRTTGEILEMLPMNPGDVTQVVDPSVVGAPVQYYLFGRAVERRDIWHLKGPRRRGQIPVSAAALSQVYSV